MPMPLARALLANACLAGAMVAGFGSPALADSYPRQPGIDIRGYVFRIEVRDDTPAIAAEADVDVVFWLKACASCGWTSLARQPTARPG
jgi:hypothetical protein